MMVINVYCGTLTWENMVEISKTHYSNLTISNTAILCNAYTPDDSQPDVVLAGKRVMALNVDNEIYVSDKFLTHLNEWTLPKTMPDTNGKIWKWLSHRYINNNGGEHSHPNEIYLNHQLAFYRRSDGIIEYYPTRITPHGLYDLNQFITYVS